MRPTDTPPHSPEDRIEDLKIAIAAADAGEFASNEEVLAVFARYAYAESEAMTTGGTSASSASPHSLPDTHE